MTERFKDYDHGSGPSTSLSLLQEACKGSQDAWRCVAQIYGPIVYGWARRTGLQNSDASDVMQETLVAVSSAIQRFRSDSPSSSFRGWLWTITRNKLNDRYRRLQKLPMVSGGSTANFALQQIAEPLSESLSNLDQPPSEFDTDAAHVEMRLLEILKTQFTPRIWQMFWETTVMERSPDEVAQEMETTKWAVYKARARVLQKLKQDFRELL